MVQIIGGAVYWQSGFAVDCDGSPHAYHPDSAMGLDRLANAGKPGDWWALACNDMGVPFIQVEGDPAPGFYVSTTALVDRTKSIRDPNRYVDASKVPYVSVARDLLGGSAKVRMGDVCWVTHNGYSCGAIIADVSPMGHYGEGSIALADTLGIPSSPRTGGCASGVVWLAFPGSSGGWPRDRSDIQAQAEKLYAAWGGDARLSSLG